MIVREELGTADLHEKLNPTSATGVTSTLLKPTSGTYNGKCATALLITVETNPIRFRIDGTDASTTTGHLVQVGESITIVGGVNANNFSCIDTATGASNVYVTIFSHN